MGSIFLGTACIFEFHRTFDIRSFIDTAKVRSSFACPWPQYCFNHSYHENSNIADFSFKINTFQIGTYLVLTWDFLV
jgi:hypothetical protein